MPVAMPQNVPAGAQQSSRRRTMTWLGTATMSSRMLPRSSQRVARLSSASGSSDFAKLRKTNCPYQSRKIAESEDARCRLLMPTRISFHFGEFSWSRFGECASSEQRVVAKNGKRQKIPARNKFARKNAVTMTGIFSGRRAGSRRSAMLMGSNRSNLSGDEDGEPEPIAPAREI
jgi:hypothetical protein